MTHSGDNRHLDRRLEAREVDVTEPELSPAMNRRLTEEVREVIGSDHVEVPVDRARPSHGDPAPRTHRALAPWLPDNLIIVVMGPGAIVTAAVIALLTNSWWVLPAVVSVLGAMTFVVVAIVLRMTTKTERPSPSIVAALEEEGIRNPEQLFSDVVTEFTQDRGALGENRRTTSAEDHPVKAAAEQESAITPTSGPSHAVGPGRSVPPRGYR
jgi:hypothetical protein